MTFDIILWPSNCLYFWLWVHACILCSIHSMQTQQKGLNHELEYIPKANKQHALSPQHQLHYNLSFHYNHGNLKILCKYLNASVNISFPLPRGKSRMLNIYIVSAPEWDYFFRKMLCLTQNQHVRFGACKKSKSRSHQVCGTSGLYTWHSLCPLNLQANILQ